MNGFIEITESGAQALEELAGQASLNMESLTNDTERFLAKVNGLEGLGPIQDSVIEEAKKVKTSISNCQTAVEETNKRIKNTAAAIRKYLQHKG